VAVDTIYSVEQTWKELENFGHVLAKLNAPSLLARSLTAGTFVGFGGILCASVGFDMGSLVWEPGNGLARFFSGAVGFPLSILLVALTGNGAWTGDMLLVARAFFSSDSEPLSLLSVARFALLTWIGSCTGAFLMALLATGAKLPAVAACASIAAHKLEFTPLQTFLRGVGGGSLICLAVFFSRLNRDMIGKVLGIWFPISTYVICDFEHVLASMFFLSTAKLNGAKIPLARMAKFLAWSTLGNLVGGFFVIGFALASIPKQPLVVEDKK